MEGIPTRSAERTLHLAAAWLATLEPPALAFRINFPRYRKSWAIANLPLEDPLHSKYQASCIAGIASGTVGFFVVFVGMYYINMESAVTQATEAGSARYQAVYDSLLRAATPKCLYCGLVAQIVLFSSGIFDTWAVPGRRFRFTFSEWFLAISVGGILWSVLTLDDSNGPESVSEACFYFLVTQAVLSAGQAWVLSQREAWELPTTLEPPAPASKLEGSTNFTETQYPVNETTPVALKEPNGSYHAVPTWIDWTLERCAWTYISFGIAGALLNLCFGIAYLLYDADPVFPLMEGLFFVLTGCVFCVGLFAVCCGALHLALLACNIMTGTSLGESRLAGVVGGIVGFVLVFLLWLLVAEADALRLTVDCDPGYEVVRDREFREGLNYCLSFGIVGQVVLHLVGAKVASRSGAARTKRFQFALKDWFVATGAGAMLFAFVSLVEELSPSFAQGLAYCLVTQAALTCGQVWLYTQRDRPAG